MTQIRQRICLRLVTFDAAKRLILSTPFLIYHRKGGSFRYF